MRGLNTIWGICLLFAACQSGRIELEGTLKDMDVDQVYLCEIVNEHYDSYKPIDSIAVVNGKFSRTWDSLAPQLYYLVAGGKGGKLFVEPGRIRVTEGEVGKRSIDWLVEGSPTDAAYRRYRQQEDSVTYKETCDSLDRLFFAARDKEDREEMERIRAITISYYDKGGVNKRKLVGEWIEANKNTLLGVYLYFSREFFYTSFLTLEQVEKERQYLSTFSPELEGSVYVKQMNRKLDNYAGCAIGAIAPEVQGLDTLDRPFKLSDLRGQYVILDFWNSYCHWCREETPWLQEALKHFEGKKLTVLGISSDRYKKSWMAAIHEDKSYWHHLMIQKGDNVMERYCIKGIPHTVLIDPEGRILAKDFRQKEVIPELEKWID